MQLIEAMISTLPDGPVCDIRIGAFWTAVVVDGPGQSRCGLASTMSANSDHHHGGDPAVRDAGQLLPRSARELAALAHSAQPMEAAIGMAAINALLPLHPTLWTDINAGEVIARHGAGKRVVVVGHFPFVSTVRERVGQLSVLEQRPRGRDLPAEAASEVIPTADVVAITGTTLLNHTLDGLLALCRPEALVLLLGPSTPLSPLLFEHGIDLLAGAVVEDVASVLRAVSQGANFRQLHKCGVRLVTMQKSNLDEGENSA